MAYIGQNADGNFTTSVSKDTFSGNGSTTAFTLSEGATTNTVDVFVENIRQEPTTAYTVDGTTLTFTAAPVTGTDNIYVVNRGPIQLSASHPAAQALTAFSATITNDLTVDTNTLYVDSTNNRVGIGIASPSTDLHLFKATGDTGVTIQSSAEANAKAFIDLYGRDASNVNQIWKIENDAHNLKINDDGSTKAMITGQGDILQNTTSRTSISVDWTADLNPVIEAKGNGTYGGLLHLNNEQNTNGLGISSIVFGNTANSNASAATGRVGAGILANCVTSDSNADDDAGAYLRFFTKPEAGNLTERMRILSGGGLTFNGDGAQANALDDYEEGTWTPSIGTGTVNAQAARYVKIGQQVTVWGYLQTFSDRSTASAINISGLPFTSASDNFASGATFHRFINANGDMVTAYIPQSTTTMTFYSSLKNAGYVNVLHSHLSSTSSVIFFTISYRA